MNLLRSRFWLNVGLALLVALTACGLVPTDPTPLPTGVPTASPLPSPTPLPRGGNVTIRLAEDLPDLRPWQPRSRGEEQVIGLLYSGLMRLDDQLRPQPDLAAAWAASADGRVLTFTLRTDLRWHDGQPLTSADVRFTLDRLHTLPYTSTALLTDLRLISAIGTPNDTTAVLTLTERYAPLLTELTVPILPRHLLQDRSFATLNAWDVPIGSGPFRFEEHAAGRSISLIRNTHFYRGEPLLDRVVFVVAPDPAVASEALGTGQLLVAELPWSTSKAISGTLTSLRVGAYAENGNYFLGFNLRQDRIFSDQRLRSALARAIDLPRLVESVTKGQGQLIGNSAAPGSWADLTPPVPPTPDLDGARTFLDTAGWTLPAGATIRQHEGISLTARLFVRADDERRVAAAQRIAAAAATIGMHIIVEPADFNSVVIPKYAPPFDFDLLLGSWSNGAGDPNFADYVYYDPDDFPLFHSSQINQGIADLRITRNFVAFRDSAYDNQSQAARQLYSIEERRSAYQQMQARIAALLPYLYLWTDRMPVVIATRLTTLDGPIRLDIPNYLWNIERWYLP